MEQERRNYPILWDEIEINPSVQLKFGIKRKVIPLQRTASGPRGSFRYINEYIELNGRWDNSPVFGSLLCLRLTNISTSSIRITRLVFPTENGLDDYIKDFDPDSISFLRNGYQSWSTARSYKLKDKPLRPWLGFVSLASSNMANLPSNTAGIISSEMYSIICDSKKDEDFLVGQCDPFNQFFYIQLNLFGSPSRKSHFELVYDFGRKLIAPGDSLDLDGILMAKGETHTLQRLYFSYIRDRMKIRIPKENVRGWCTWYCYLNKISPDEVLKNLEAIKKRELQLDFIQIDDGYQQKVGDWLQLQPDFEGKMRVISDAIQEAGYRPGIWIAPFVAERKSELAEIHPEYLLRNEYGKAIVAGYNFFWPGRLYYGLDITNPRFEEYIRNVIRTVVQEWGFSYIKCDFLFGGCLRGGTHNDLSLSRAEVLKYGMKLIREEAGKDTFIVGCGMPLSTGIGTVDAMRVGPDTGPYWKKPGMGILNTGAIVGMRNSIRNFTVRSAMHKRLWLSDPDCLMIRTDHTGLTSHERASQINAIILSGGLLLYSDNFAALPDRIFNEIETINSLSEECFEGFPVAIDLMEQEMPEIVYNTAGYLGIFNFSKGRKTKTADLSLLPDEENHITQLQDVWNGDVVDVEGAGQLTLKKMSPHSSRLFRVIRGR
jgi:alpha-galactosidase